jgi:oxygen-dependent protoporphyrinogen oxidase
MSKNILIIGGGVSGLSLLHYLKSRYADRPDVHILLMEKESSPGGTIRTIRKNGCLFEAGPNGFLDSKPRTLDFVSELGLAGELVRAEDASKIRYIALKSHLHPLPAGPKDFFAFRPLTFADKLRVLGEVFIAKGNDPGESVYDFGKRRLGESFARIFLDPMVSGIYGGDARQIVLRAAFGRIYALEQEHGSLFKAMMKIKRPCLPTGRQKGEGGEAGGMPSGTLTSLRGGQSQMIEALGNRYKDCLRVGEEAQTIIRQGEGFVVYSSGRHYGADEVFVSTPAYQAAAILREMIPLLADDLEKICYAPIVIVGLVFSLSVFQDRPKGFGYLIPSSEGKDVLGVLFESNIFQGRALSDKILFRIMIGGIRHPEILSRPRGELISLALAEVRAAFKLAADAAPQEIFYVSLPKAIPQYDHVYVGVARKLAERLRPWRGLYLAANYLGGVSLNDCIENAYQCVRQSSL